MIQAAFIIEINLIKKEINEEDSNSAEDSSNNIFAISNWKIKVSYLEKGNKKPEMELVKSLVKRLEKENFPEEIHFRKLPSKFMFRLLPVSAKSKKFYLLYMLDATESVEILKIPPILSLAELSERVTKKSKVNEGLAEIVAQKNNLLKKLEEKTILQKQIGSRANELIDQGEYNKAQDLMKIAKTIPDKFVKATQEAKITFKENRFGRTEKALSNAFDYAGKMEENLLQSYIKLRIDKIQEIPTYYKKLKKNLKKIRSNFSDYPEYLDYVQNFPLIEQSMDILDELEQDEEISNLLELEDLIEDAEKIAFVLFEIDQKIKALLDKISI
jgi:hypothetical protein